MRQPAALVFPYGMKLNPISDFFRSYEKSQGVKASIVDYLQNDMKQSRPDVPWGHPSLRMNHPKLNPVADKESVSITKWLPGTCTGNGGVGIGCSFHGESLESFGITVNPARQVLKLLPYPKECYRNPQPSQCDPYYFFLI